MYKFRFIGVPHGRNIVNAAEKLETAMNQLAGEGYEIQLTESKNGWLISGRKMDAPPQQTHGMPPGMPAGLAEMLASMGAVPLGIVPVSGAGSRMSRASQRTRELVDRFTSVCFTSVCDTSTPLVFVREAKEKASTCIQGFSFDELTTAAKEIDETAEHHKSGCPDARRNDCDYVKTLTALSEVVRHEAKNNVQ